MAKEKADNVTTLPNRTTELGEGVNANGTKTIEDMAEEDVFGKPLEGTDGQLSFAVKGQAKQLLASVLEVKKLPNLYIEGQYQPGDVIYVLAKVEVEDVKFKTQKDKHGTPLGMDRVHYGIAMGVEQRPEPEAE